MSTLRKKLSLGWRLNLTLFPRRRLFMGVFSDEFLFRTEEKLWLVGHYRLENEGRHFSYRTSGVVSADSLILTRAVRAGEERELVQHLEEIGLRYGPLRTA